MGECEDAGPNRAVCTPTREHQIQIVYTPYTDWPTKEYMDWWVVACRRQFLSEDHMLHDPRSVQLPDDVPPTVTQPRDQIVLPHDAPAHGRRAQQQHPDVELVGRMISRVERMSTKRLSTVDRRTYPMGLMCMIRAGLMPRHRVSTIVVEIGLGLRSWDMMRILI
ncbi:hypothetical protein PIB30_072583 [Stylosanthes scabra]|uniref:Uncharacterized protein n=1 Tax=Stylosanthes scabra TaxID=79078 RepID=A0ABU6UMV3_9FABA|nr:hypothetical protein [Stylosanthes scabra]